MPKTNSNAVSLAGEFAVLSQLALRGYDANMTLGHPKGIDILVADPETLRIYKREVKTNYQTSRTEPQVSGILGKAVSSWIMNRKHEGDRRSGSLLCFVNIGKPTNVFRFWIVPSSVVARYVKEEHALWLKTRR